MRVVVLAAGAANMFCGSCLRDNRLASALRARGRDVLLMPLYTPLRTDEPSMAEASLHYGGVNVFLQQRSALFRWLPGWADRWLNSAALVRKATAASTSVDPRALGELTVSILRGPHGRQAKELERLVADLRQLRPAVVNLPNAMFIGAASRLREALDARVVCTLSGEDSFLDRLQAPFREQAYELIRANANAVDAFVATSRFYARRCAERFALPTQRVHAAPLGAPRAAEPSATRDSPSGPFVIGFLARITPDKGLLELCRVVAELRLRGRNCHLKAAGYLALSDRAYLDAIRDFMRQSGHAEAFEYLGEVSAEQKRAFLRSLHAFSMPAVYPEAKGLSVLEALAEGVPVVQPAEGAFVEMIEATGGGLLYDPASPEQAAHAFIRLMDDPPLRRALGAAGAAGVRSHYTEHHMAERVWEIYERVIAERANG